MAEEVNSQVEDQNNGWYYETQDSPEPKRGQRSRMPLIVIIGIIGILGMTLLHPPAHISATQISAAHISPIFTREVQYWDSNIVNWSEAAGVDPDLAATVMQVESCGDPKATSGSGAMSLFQVMPFHFNSGENPYDPSTNAFRGLSYLKKSLDAAGGNARLAMAGYNGGIGVIGRAESLWPAQTQRYATYSTIYFDAISGATQSDALMSWYSQYGRSLCNQASVNLGLK